MPGTKNPVRRCIPFAPYVLFAHSFTDTKSLLVFAFIRFRCRDPEAFDQSAPLHVSQALRPRHRPFATPARNVYTLVCQSVPCPTGIHEDHYIIVP